MRKSELQEIIKELIKQELDEASVTGNLDGGEGPPRTPYAFSGKKKKDKKKRKKIATTSTGYELVSEEITDKDLRKISDIIRMEVALIFFDLFKKKALWT
tara:strand:- start:292 stop:591 length:300 start_codon:yes stop_codon:yes gene_type:complete